MNQHTSGLTKAHRRSAIIAQFTIPFFMAASLPAEVDEELEKIVVSATKTPRSQAEITAAVTVIDPRSSEIDGIYQLRDLLNQSPGVIATSTGGQTGAVGSLFMRGTTTAYSHMVIDGMRLGDSTTPLGNMFAASRSFDVGRIEVLRGPQGAIHGGESVGGVIWLETTRGEGDPSGSLFLEAGSFDSFTAWTTQQGEIRDLSYFIAGGYEETSNDSPKNDFHQGSIAMRLEQKVNASWNLGMTWRGVDSYYQNFGNSDERVDASLLTLKAEGTITEAWKTRIHAGFHQESYDSDSSSGNYGTDMRTWAFSKDHELQLTPQLRATAGMFFHRADFSNTISTDVERNRHGIHGSLEWEPAEDWLLSSAARWEDDDAYGQETTWRLGALKQLSNTQTSLRAGIGTSFKSPTFLDLYGSSFGAGNPNLDAESAIGGDIGIMQKFSAHTAELTYFSQQIEDRINSFSLPAPSQVDGTVHARGIEASCFGPLIDEKINYRLSATWLDRALVDQPEWHVDASLDYDFSENISCGVGVQYLSDHSWGGSPIDDYTLARLHASWQVHENVRLQARLENLTDENYLLSNFFGTPVAGSGRALYLGLEWTW